MNSLGWLLFGGLEDGAKILPEPLLDSDVSSLMCTEGNKQHRFRRSSRVAIRCSTYVGHTGAVNSLTRSK